MLRIVVLALASFCCLGGPATTNSEVAAAEKKPEVQEYCPVFTDRIVGPSSRSLRYRGIEIFFSSDLAARKWLRDPVSYLDKKLLPQLTDLILAQRLMPQHYCPVYKTRKISLKDPSVLYNGKRVFLFDSQALKIWNSAPEKFLDPDILPQFADGEKPPETDEEEKP